MAVLHRALFTWLMSLIFLIMLVLRLDDKVDWNWFLIFIPMWVYDTAIVIAVLVGIVKHCKNRTYHDRGDTTMKQRVWYMASLFLKLSFEILICLKYQYFNTKLALFYVLLPFWLLLIGGLVDVGYSVFGQCRSS